ncbi:MAG: hypothetical protein IZT57_00170 [Chloroflexi bacterium]|nr:hypothetical protein [Chloroflexota bacterium]
MSSKSSDTNIAPNPPNEAIKHFRKSVGEGKHWYISLLEATRLWQDKEDVIDGRRYCYLIEDEALDCLLIAERICGCCSDLIPPGEMENYLFKDTPPIDIATAKFKELIGEDKYRQHLNFFYGVVVEQNLFLAVQKEIRKENQPLVHKTDNKTINEAFCRIYDSSVEEMLKLFCHQKHRRHIHSLKLSEFNEFCYWLFKYRLRNCDKDKVASDTKKALRFINKSGRITPPISTFP